MSRAHRRRPRRCDHLNARWVANLAVTDGDPGDDPLVQGAIAIDEPPDDLTDVEDDGTGNR